MPSKRDAMTARALALVGCGYIYGATGWICTHARMEQQMRQYPVYAGQIERYGKKWIGKPCYDCAQLTRDVARRAGVSLPSGATSQWRAAGIWKEKDVIDTLPDEAGIFLFSMRDGRMTHTGWRWITTRRRTREKTQGRKRRSSRGGRCAWAAAERTCARCKRRCKRWAS